MLFLIIMTFMTLTAAGPTGKKDANETSKQSRRILQGHSVGDTKPYMVYLRPSSGAENVDPDWVCGGAIIHERYILTSAACIEDIKTFYVVSGTYKWTPVTEHNDECVKNGAKKAVWKCVPKAYVYDGNEFDNISWMIGDIAVVKVEDDFNFERRIKGCDFIPKKVAYNNFSEELIAPRTYGSIAGWGSNDTYKNWMQEETLRTHGEPVELQQTEVRLISSANCKKRWEPRYHYIIDDQMICTKDIDDAAMSAYCAEREVNCKELDYDDDEKEEDYEHEHVDHTNRRMVPKPGALKVHHSGHFHETRRKSEFPTGGFCENDHGGPLIVGHGKSAVVVGVMSACQAKDVRKKCTGPFLFTNVFRYSNMITCAIDKDVLATCKKLLRSSRTATVETYFDWPDDQEIPREKIKREKQIKRSGRRTSILPEKMYKVPETNGATTNNVTSDRNRITTISNANRYF